MTSFNQDIKSGGSGTNGSPCETVTPNNEPTSLPLTTNGVFGHNPPIPSDVAHAAGPNTIQTKFFESMSGSPAPLVSPFSWDFPIKNVIKK